MDGPDSRLTGPPGLVRWILWAQRKAADDWVKERSLSFEQGFALGYLARFPGAIQRDIAQLNGTTARACRACSRASNVEASSNAARRTATPAANASMPLRPASR